MPRQDVPYGGAICRLKERIAEIWDKLDQKLHSINGVEGDGAGNVDIVSGDAAVVINNDQIGHRIEVALDSSKLPASSVSSVNGQTGAVRLDAADIPSDGNSNVQADIAANKAAINDCFDSITSEQVARQNADATLQTNINAARASIPEMSATPDPYKGVERDAQGRAFAADPASGATDKTLVTANWVSQTGDSAPNNLVHRTANETIYGRKTLTQRANNGIMDLIGNAQGVQTRGLTPAYTNHIYTYLTVANRTNSVHIDRVVIGPSALTVTRTMLVGTFSNLYKYSVKTNPEGVDTLCVGCPYHNAQSVILLSHTDSYGVTTYEPIDGRDSDSWQVVMSE